MFRKNKKLIALFIAIINMLILSSCSENIEQNDSNIEGNNGNNNNITKPKIQCLKEYYKDEIVSFEIKTDDNRALNHITWQSKNNNVELIENKENLSSINVKMLKTGSETVSILEDIFNYEDSCSFNIIEKVIHKPNYSDIELICPQTQKAGDSFTLSVTTSDNRQVNTLSWTKSNDNIMIHPNEYNHSANIQAKKEGTTILTVQESITNYTKQCVINIEPVKPQIIVNDSYLSLLKGETKTIQYHIEPRDKDQRVIIKDQSSISGFDFQIQQGEISITAKENTAAANIILVSESLKIESTPIYISSSTDYGFKLEKTVNTYFNDNKAHEFTIRIKKNTPYSSYKLYQDNEYNGWLKHKGRNVINDTTDEYTFYMEENNRIRTNSHTIIFLPGNSDNINDRNAVKINVFQGRNYEPKVRNIKFFYGTTKQYKASDFVNEWNTVQNEDDKYYKGREILEYYLLEDGFQGWFNANKIEGKERVQHRDGLDNQMCWAYATTNALHWWFENNKSEYEKYKSINDPKKDKERYEKGYYNLGYKPSHNITAGKTNDLQKRDERKEKSDIAKTYRKEFYENKGGHIIDSIEWFLVGKDYHNYIENNSSIVKTGFGIVKELFKDTYKRDIVVRKKVDEITQDDLNKIFKDALNNNRILILQYSSPSLGYIHAVNIWGIVEDEYGDVCEVYIGDNNLPSLSDYTDNDATDLNAHPKYGYVSNSYLLKYGLEIKDSSTYLVNLVTGKKGKGFLMNSIFEIDLGKQYFTEYFKKNNIN